MTDNEKQTIYFKEGETYEYNSFGANWYNLQNWSLIKLISIKGFNTTWQTENGEIFKSKSILTHQRKDSNMCERLHPTNYSTVVLDEENGDYARFKVCSLNISLKKI